MVADNKLIFGDMAFTLGDVLEHLQRPGAPRFAVGIPAYENAKKVELRDPANILVIMTVAEFQKEEQRTQQMIADLKMQFEAQQLGASVMQ